MIELKPCPFCGGEARLGKTHPGPAPDGDARYGTTVWGVYCPNEECCVVSTDWRSTETEAIEAWNRRTNGTDITEPEPARTCRNVYGGREFECSECGMQWHLLDRASPLEEWAHVRQPRFCPECGAKVVKE